MKTVRNISFGPQGPATRRTYVSKRRMNRLARSMGFTSHAHRIAWIRAQAGLATAGVPVKLDDTFTYAPPKSLFQRIWSGLKEFFA